MPELSAIANCVICGKALRLPRQHVGTCGKRCYRTLLTRQRATGQRTEWLMRMYYLRWPNGVHTIAVAPTVLELWDLLTEEGEPESALVFELPEWSRLAVDFVRRYPSVRESECRADERPLATNTLYSTNESTHGLMERCLALPDSELVAGAKFFAGCFEQRTGA